MVLNYIWIGFFVVAFVFGGVQLLMGDTTIFQKNGGLHVRHV